ncbi:Major facilitator superfamily domain-containing protein 6 [Portunus trituberculatus]|uniref:Major facilitator superfamily domain-containing protein 6 n=1 Tax=Portunus trituberculatus TaxID=210409 RepID=A0A5B7DHL0_PORTR|nr:Major facilitator superfamily domain-containing protein 6 [Portunus trituberculatus]
MQDTMLSRVNKDLLPLKIHYFFKYGGIAFFTFLPVVARQKGIPAVAVGLIWMVTPMSSCAINLFTSAMADKFKVYRAMFLGGMVTLTFSFISFFLLPNVVTQTPMPLHSTSPPLHCTDPNASSLALCSAAVPYNLSSWNCNEKADNKKDDRQCVLQCYDQQNSDDSVLNQTVVFKDLNLNFNSDAIDQYHVCEEESCTLISSSSSPCGAYHMFANCSYYCQAEPLTLLQLTQRGEFWLIFVLLITIYGGNSTTTTMADTICFQLLGKERRHLYGRQRLFGSIGWGIVGLSGGALIDYFSHGNNQQANYMPVVVLASIFLGCNLVVSSRIPFKVHDREKLKASHVGRALCNFPFLVYIVTVVVCGLNMGIVWTFIFIVVEDVAGSAFAHIKLLQGIFMGVGCFLGEVPSLFLSALVIKKLGSEITFGISLTAMAIRVFLYSTVSNPWFFPPIELLHGASFGLFYPNMIATASQMSPPGAMATVQGIVKTTFITGVSLGSLVGGLMVSAVGGSNTFFYVGILDATYVVLFGIAHYLLRVHCTPGAPADYHPPGTAETDLDMIPEEQRSVCDLQVCTPCPDLPELEHSDHSEHHEETKHAMI